MDVPVQAHHGPGPLEETSYGLRADGLSGVQGVETALIRGAVEHADGVAGVVEGDGHEIFLDAGVLHGIFSVRAWPQPVRIAHDGELARHVGVTLQVPARIILHPERRIRNTGIAEKGEATQMHGLPMDVDGLGKGGCKTLQHGNPVVVAGDVEGLHARVRCEERGEDRGKIAVHEAELALEVILEAGAAVDEGDGAGDQGGEDVAAEDDALHLFFDRELHHPFIQDPPAVKVTGEEHFHVASRRPFKIIKMRMDEGKVYHEDKLYG